MHFVAFSCSIHLVCIILEFLKALATSVSQCYEFALGTFLDYLILSTCTLDYNMFLLDN